MHTIFCGKHLGCNLVRLIVCPYGKHIIACKPTLPMLFTTSFTKMVDCVVKIMIDIAPLQIVNMVIDLVAILVVDLNSSLRDKSKSYESVYIMACAFYADFFVAFGMIVLGKYFVTSPDATATTYFKAIMTVYGFPFFHTVKV